MSVRSNSNAITTPAAAAPAPGATVDLAEAQEAVSLAEGQSYNQFNSAKPLSRTVSISIRSTLNELCLQKNRGVWSPSTETLKNILQQKRFVDLSGNAEAQGDLSSVCLHSLKLKHSRSSFPISLGVRATGVDDACFSSSGEVFSTILLPESESARERVLQEDDVSLCQSFASRFPGYTANNLDSKGVHEVAQRRFVLVSADHPIVSAIQENADKLQMGEISMMPEGLVKISSSLYENILPLVKTQVQSQIKVRDLSACQVSIQPADHASWTAARADLIVEAKRPLKAQLATELGACETDEQQDLVRAKYESFESDLESQIDNRPLEVNLELGIEYNFLSK